MTVGSGIRIAGVAAVFTGWMATACTVAMYEETPGEKRRLASGQEVLLVWPEADAEPEPVPTLFVQYVSSRPTQVEDEARAVWEAIRPDAEQRKIRRVAVCPTVIDRGLKWRDGRPSFWRASTSFFWHGQGADGRWTDGDPGVSP